MWNTSLQRDNFTNKSILFTITGDFFLKIGYYLLRMEKIFVKIFFCLPISTSTDKKCWKQVVPIGDADQLAIYRPTTRYNGHACILFRYFGTAENTFSMDSASAGCPHLFYSYCFKCWIISILNLFCRLKLYECILQYEWSHRAKRREMLKHVESALSGSAVVEQSEDIKLAELLVCRKF